MKILGRPSLIVAMTLAVVWALPLASLLTNSLKRDGLGNYAAVIQQGGIVTSLINSAIITLTTVAAVVFIASAAGFAFSRLRFRFRSLSYGMLLTGLMLPAGAVLVPFAQLNRAFGWGNTYASVIFPYIALFFPLGLLLLKNAFDNLPDELFEAATLDGAGVWRIFRSVAMPLVAPAASLVALWTFLSTWNEFLLALLFLNDPAVQPVSVIPLRFQQQYFIDVPKIFAALLLSQLPVVILYVFTQRRFTLGLFAGTGK